MFVRFCLTAVDISRKKALDADSRAIQQIIFIGEIKVTVANARVIIFYVLEKSKGTILEFPKGTTSFVSKLKILTDHFHSHYYYYYYYYYYQ